MQDKYFTTAEINYFFQALKKGEHIEWPIIGYLILSAEHIKLWQADFKSFTEWIRVFSREIKRQESLCWRYLAAAKFYLKLHDILNDNNIECPAITALSEDISPENVELLSKLYRVMPQDQFLNYAQRTIENDIKRKELREAWSIFRPTLEGRTARGIKVAPSINIHDQNQFNSQAEAIAITSLINSDGAWAKQKASDFYKTFRQIELPITISGNEYRYEPDLIALTGNRESRDLLVHLVEYSGRMNNQQAIDKLVSASSKVNFIWIMLQEDALDSTVDYPNTFGLITQIGSNNSLIYRKAKCLEVDQRYILKELLLHNM